METSWNIVVSIKMSSQKRVHSKGQTIHHTSKLLKPFEINQYKSSLTNFDHLNSRRMARVWVSEYTPEEQRFQAFAILELTPVQDSCCLRCLSHANILCSPEWCYHILSHPVKQTKLNNLYPSTTNNSTCTQRGERLITPFILGRGQERKGAELVFGRQCLRKQSLELLGSFCQRLCGHVAEWPRSLSLPGGRGSQR